MFKVNNKDSIVHLLVVFILLTLNMQLPAGCTDSLEQLYLGLLRMAVFESFWNFVAKQDSNFHEKYSFYSFSKLRWVLLFSHEMNTWFSQGLASKDKSKVLTLNPTKHEKMF